MVKLTQQIELLLIYLTVKTIISLIKKNRHLVWAGFDPLCVSDAEYMQIIFSS